MIYLRRHLRKPRTMSRFQNLALQRECPCVFVMPGYLHFYQNLTSDRSKIPASMALISVTRLSDGTCCHYEGLLTQCEMSAVETRQRQVALRSHVRCKSGKSKRGDDVPTPNHRPSWPESLQTPLTSPSSVRPHTGLTLFATCGPQTSRMLSRESPYLFTSTRVLRDRYGHEPDSEKEWNVLTQLQG